MPPTDGSVPIPPFDDVDPTAWDDRFMLAWQAAPHGMMLLDLQGRWLELNRALSELLGHDVDDLVGGDGTSVTDEQGVEAAARARAALLEQGEASFTFEKRYRHKDGQAVDTEVSARLVADHAGEPCFIVADVRELAAQRRMEEQLRRSIAELERSNETLAHLASVTSHDLTTPLGTATGLLETALAQGGQRLEPAIRELIEAAARQTGGALESAAALLRAARTDARLQRQSTTVGELVDGLRETLGPRLTSAGVSLRVQGTGIELKADVAQLLLVLQNLVSNALRHEAPDRPLAIEVRARRDGDLVELLIDDTGTGIPAADRQRVFELGYQGDTQAGSDGIGVGLATCRRIIELHGGTITAEPRDGGGTRMVVRLPSPSAHG